jgi:hypothetical protein
MRSTLQIALAVEAEGERFLFDAGYGFLFAWSSPVCRWTLCRSCS